MPSNTLSQAMKSLEKSSEAFEKAVGEGLSLAETGSGKIPLLLLPVGLDSTKQRRGSM